MRILVTGAAGYIGSALLKALGAHEVVATDQSAPAPRLSYGAHKLVCEILIDDYTRRGYLDGRALRLPAVLVRPGSSNTALSGGSSAITREPLAGRDYVCPVRLDTRIACISLNKVVQSEMWDAVKRKASGRVRFAPDPRIQPLMDAAPRAAYSRRAAALGLPHGRSIDEIVREYEEAALAHHG